MEKQKKNYVGNWKEIINQYGSMLNISLNVDKLNAIKNEKGYARVTITKNREPDQYGNTHSVVENTWKPQVKGISQSEAQSVFKDSNISIDQVPF